MTRLIAVLFILLIICILELSGCSYQEFKESTAQVTNPSKTEPPIDQEPNPYGFNWINQNIFQTKCTHCHSGPNPRSGYDMSTYEGIMALVHPTDPENSLLYMMLEWEEMPPKGPPLTTHELQCIADWIRSGAAND